MSRLSPYSSLLFCTAALLFVAGCGNDSNEFNAGPQHAQAQQPYSPPSTPPPMLPPAPPAPDPLSAGGDALASGGDPLASGGDALGSATDPMNGPAMPTDHSHWLVAEVENAQVTLTLDGLSYGGDVQTSTHDITMKLHKGANRMTIHYVPLDNESSAHITVLESEHDPPIPPLIDFRALPLASDPTVDWNSKPKPITKTFFFYAR